MLGHLAAQPAVRVTYTPEEIKGIIAKAQQLKSNGASEQSDPEFARLIGILREYSVMTQRQQVQQQQQIQQQSQLAGVGSPSQPQGSFTPAQLDVLRYQIQSYKLLAANKAVPDFLQQAAFDPASAAQAPAATELPPPAMIAQGIVAGAVKQEQLAQHPGGPAGPAVPVAPAAPAAQDALAAYSSPHVLSNTQISFAEFQKRLIVPSAMPTPIDHAALKAERERYLAARVEFRIKELESLPSNLSADLKLKSVIELKALRLLDKQRQLRAEIAESLSRSTTLATAVDRSTFRRVKKQSLREAHKTEQREREQRSEREKRERQKHTDFLETVNKHGRDFLAFHKQQQTRCVKLGNLIQRFHQNAAKEEERRLQRVSQERLNALKANDEEAYLKLIDKTKDTRITHLLEQTNSFLVSLTNAVEKQKSFVGNDFEIPVDQSAVVEDEDPEGTRDYYATAHRIREEVTEQPSILIGGTLKEYQIKGLQWMVSLYNNRLNGILADEMGLGKTIQTLSLITYLIEKKKQPGPFLVIVPLSTMTNWVLEFEKWAPAVKKIVYKGSPTERKNLASTVKAGDYNVIITTFEYIINPKDRPVLSKVKWVYMIIDEGHRLKNTESRLSTTLADYYSSRYRLILTGTPLQNNLPELWALLNFILPKIFNSVKSFDEWFNSPFSGSSGTGQDRIELNEEEQLLIIRRLHKVMRPFLLRRLKKDVESELPDKVETVVKCPMSALQQKLYDQIRNRRFGGEAFNKKKALNNLVMQFRKICNHPFVFDEVEDIINPQKVTDKNLYRVAGKFELLDRVLPKFKATGHRVLIFFQMTQIMDIMEDYLRWRGHTYLRLDGHTKPEERTIMLKTFNSPDNPPFIFLLSTRAGGLGLNLQTADTVIIYDSDWNPHQDLQAQDRAHRIGQKKEVRILRLITAKSVEETILARAQFKLEIDGKVIQAGKFDNKTSDREREELLRSLFGGDDEEEEKDDTKEKEGELEDAELNEIIARNQEEIEIFERMDQERRQQDEMQWRQAGNRGPPPPRLMQESELPQVFLEEPPADDKIGAEIYLGRGGRQRKEVSYDDGLNEDQWLNAIDHGDLEGYIARKRKNKLAAEARQKAKASSQRDGDDDDDEGGEGGNNGDPLELPDPVHAEEAPEEPAPKGQASKKRSRSGRSGRKSNASTAPASDPAAPDDDDAGAAVDDEGDNDDGGGGGRNKKRAKRGGGGAAASRGGAAGSDKRRKKLFADVDPDAPDTVDPAVRAALRRTFATAYKAVEEAEVESDDGYTRRRCELYLTLPDRADYADYYRFIDRPIAMDMIQHRARHAYYRDVASFVADFHLMFANAMKYNVEGSDVWLDAVELKKIFDDAIAQLCPGGQVQILAEDVEEAQRSAMAAAAASGGGGAGGTGAAGAGAGAGMERQESVDDSEFGGQQASASEVSESALAGARSLMDGEDDE
ncbi:ATP-dependent DNA helicase Snf21 [Polyrhizophydium stewartii]|uniref:ATP-dependent DNA helicase Snf21 n=1 Tax=Polyrhizophydium stewartii TaxID=2732419 RepID=A0ABR4N4Z1_9FUNG